MYAAAAESEQPSFRRFHVPCRHVPDPAVAAPGPSAQQEGAYVTRLLAAMPPSAGFTNILDVNAESGGSFGLAMR